MRISSAKKNVRKKRETTPAQCDKNKKRPTAGVNKEFIRIVEKNLKRDRVLLEKLAKI